MSDIPENLVQAVGRMVEANDMITAAPVAGLRAAFGYDEPEPLPGDVLPPLWHGLFCTTKLPPSRLGPDGLAKDEGLLPAVPDFPNKLFGGARFEFRVPLRIGEDIRKESEVRSFDLKEGKSGAFIVGVIEHRILNAQGVAVIEQNDIIFRPPAATLPASIGAMREPSGEAQKPSPPSVQSPASTPSQDATWTRMIAPDPVLMFRHSAVTFNSHRIHYDRDYVREKGYPGLLVQGTLIARLMLDMLRQERPGFEVTSFSFRSGRPVYDDGNFTIGATLQDDRSNVLFHALDHAGNMGMTAQATCRSG